MYLSGSMFAPIGISILAVYVQLCHLVSVTGIFAVGQTHHPFSSPTTTTNRYRRATCDLTHLTHVSFFDKMGALLSLPLLAVPSLSTVRHIETQRYALKTPESRPGPVFHRLLFRAYTMRLTC